MLTATHTCFNRKFRGNGTISSKSMNDPKVLVGKEQFQASDIDSDWAQMLLETARRMRVRPLCDCTPGQPALYIRGNAVLSLARMPGTRAKHDVECAFAHEYPHVGDGGHKHATPQASSAAPSRCSVTAESLSLLWKKAGLHLWKSSFRFRTWSLARHRLLKSIGGPSTSSPILDGRVCFLPEAFTATSPNAASDALMNQLNVDGISSLVLIAPVKATYVNQHLPVLVLRHLPTIRIFVRNLKPAPSGLCVAKLNIYLTGNNLYGTDVEYLQVNEVAWLPIASDAHAAEVARLIASGANFTVDLPFGPLGGFCHPFAYRRSDSAPAQSTIR